MHQETLQQVTPNQCRCTVGISVGYMPCSGSGVMRSLSLLVPNAWSVYVRPFIQFVATPLDQCALFMCCYSAGTGVLCDMYLGLYRIMHCVGVTCLCVHCAPPPLF